MKYEVMKEKGRVFAIPHLGAQTLLYPVRALADFGRVRRGEVGGWVEGEQNLGQRGECWVGADCFVFGQSSVIDDGYVGGGAIVCGGRVSDAAQVVGRSILSGLCDVRGASTVVNSWLFGSALIDDRATIWQSSVFTGASIGGSAHVVRSSVAAGCVISGDAWLDGCSVDGAKRVCGGQFASQSLA